MAKIQARSPLKAKPLRYAGQSLDEEISRVLDEEVVVWVMWALMVVLFCAAEWVRWALSAEWHPLLATFLAVGAVAVAYSRFVKARKKLRALRLGRDGEREVGEQLDELRAKGYAVLHDLVGKGFNVDHLIISPQGVFTVETKTISKPVRKNPVVEVKNGRILINGRTPDRDYLKQARAQAGWVRRILRESTGKDVPVKPVIVFPGWWVVRVPKGEGLDVWVLNPDALPSFIQHEREMLAPDDVKSVTYSLVRYIRLNN